MNDSPEGYVPLAFARAGIVLHSLEVTDYRPDAFGNFVAYASTGVGPMKLIYDRAFILETDQAELGDPQLSALLDALESAKRAAAR
ncbi:hypothetical protein [Allosphingosinicella sp.]|uniref:hypothetical protein n=1 Tax=Allosphingosinicella sp. TaxID=2823234 RepID=UPI003784A7A1